VFDHPDALAALLRHAGLDDAAPLDIHALRDASIDRIADAIDAHLDTRRLAAWFGLD
jgi:adenosylcobyric acid synthase